MPDNASHRRLRVFLCHSSGDKPPVRNLYHRLQADGFDPWLDEEDLLPGQDWQREIPLAIRRSDIVVVCLSSSSITKTGYIQKELKFALDVADEQPEGTIFIIPVRIEECEIPERLSRWQWVNLFQPNGYERLVRSLRLRANAALDASHDERESPKGSGGINSTDSQRTESSETSFTEETHRNPKSSPVPKVFISYSHRDKGFVEKLYQALTEAINREELGGSVFYDGLLRGGDLFEAKLAEELEDANYILSIISPNFVEGRGTIAELRKGQKREQAGLTRVIPVLHQHVDYYSLSSALPGDLADFISKKLYVNFAASFDGGIKELLRIFGIPARKSSEPANKSTSMALVMKGGGVKGLAYVGALKELERYYYFDWFVGTSAGAIAALLLAVGYKPAELKEVLSSKNFRDFLDSPTYKLPFNIIFKGGFYEARSFTTWLDQLVARKIKSFEPLTLADLPKRVTIYASRRFRSALVFDKKGPRSDTSASFAVRCSMSIPFLFTPQRDQGLRVLDGGMQNNYPVGDLLSNNPGTQFIGLYLGNYYEGMPKEPGMIRELLSIWTESVDVEALKKYANDTIVIDPRPISTIDFSLNSLEKDFLIRVGRASALRFLLSRNLTNGPSPEEVEEAEESARLARVEVERIRRRRRLRMRLILSLSALLVAGLTAWLVYRPIPKPPQPNLNGSDQNGNVAPVNAQGTPAQSPTPTMTPGTNTRHTNQNANGNRIRERGGRGTLPHAQNNRQTNENSRQANTNDRDRSRRVLLNQNQ